MTAFQADSGRIPDGMPSDSALSKPASQQASNHLTSSRGMALAVPGVGLTDVIASLRPDWPYHAIHAAIRADDRPWATVVAGSIRGALLTGADHIRHPNGLRYVNADGHGATPVPPKYDRRIPCNCPDCAKGTP